MTVGDTVIQTVAVVQVARDERLDDERSSYGTGCQRSGEITDGVHLSRQHQLAVQLEQQHWMQTRMLLLSELISVP